MGMAVETLATVSLGIVLIIIAWALPTARFNGSMIPVSYWISVH